MTLIYMRVFWVFVTFMRIFRGYDWNVLKVINFIIFGQNPLMVTNESQQEKYVLSSDLFLN